MTLVLTVIVGVAAGALALAWLRWVGELEAEAAALSATEAELEARWARPKIGALVTVDDDRLVTARGVELDLTGPRAWDPDAVLETLDEIDRLG